MKLGPCVEGGTRPIKIRLQTHIATEENLARTAKGKL